MVEKSQKKVSSTETLFDTKTVDIINEGCINSFKLCLFFMKQHFSSQDHHSPVGDDYISHYWNIACICSILEWAVCKKHQRGGEVQLQVFVKHLEFSSSCGKGQTWHVQKEDQKSWILFLALCKYDLNLQYHGITFVIKALLISFLCLCFICLHGWMLRCTIKKHYRQQVPTCALFPFLEYKNLAIPLFQSCVSKRETAFHHIWDVGHSCT